MDDANKAVKTIEGEQTFQEQRGALKEVILYFLRLGFTGFGGPAAHIAMMHDELVRRRKWVDEGHFLDLLGATNLIPGPNSTEMTIHLGYIRAGWPGLILGGASFILPAMFIVSVLAWAYVSYGATPTATWLLYGVKPVVIGIILDALITLGRKAVTNLGTALIGAGVILGYLFGLNELLLLLAAAVLGSVASNIRQNRADRMVGLVPFAALPLGLLVGQPFRLDTLFLVFLKIGSVLYGSGYVLLAFLKADFVDRLGWLTSQQLVDAIAIGQVTPGPLFTTATFIGYQLGGIPGAVLATLGIFLPAFIFVAISNPLIPRIRNSPRARGILDGVNAASLGLMAAVTWELGQTTILDGLTLVLAAAAFLAVRFLKINSTLVVLAGLIVGLARYLIEIVS